MVKMNVNFTIIKTLDVNIFHLQLWFWKIVNLTFAEIHRTQVNNNFLGGATYSDTRNVRFPDAGV